MISERLRLTLLFLAGTVVISLIIAFTTRSALRANDYKIAAGEAMLHASTAARTIDHIKPTSGDVIFPDVYIGSQLDPRVEELLRIIPNFLIVMGPDSAPHFESRSVRLLDEADRQVLFSGIRGIADDGRAGIIKIDVNRGKSGSDDGKGRAVQLPPSREVVLVAVSLKDTTASAARVIAGVPAQKTEWPTELRIAFGAIIPLAIFSMTLGVWYFLGVSFQRIERIRQEVAAISDGRSLHRRLSVYEANPELTTLIETLNAMIARLESSFTALRRFTADASHELKTPLAVLRVDVERAMDEKTSTAEQMVALEEALQEVTRMSDLVESLLTLARADEGRFTLHREAVDLQELTQEVYETAVILGEGAGVSVNLPFTAHVTVMGDRDRLRQLFLNLVTNAIKYTPTGGRVDIGLGKHPTTVTFAVRDTGIGIAAADVPHIFERFWRADRVRSRSAERGGVGLGLAISQWIAQAHGGTLTVSSRLGKGSLFTVTLPLES